MEADGIGPALVRSLASRALTRQALVRSCRDRATGPQNAKKLFRQFCAGKELGAQVVVTKRRQSEGRLLVNDIKRNNGSAAFIGADPSPPEQVKRIVPFSTPGKERWRKERLEPPLTPCTSFDHLDLESEQGSSIH